MKTIYTTLPIYNSLVKQTFERSKKVANDGTFAIVCPITEIPSFQWLDYGDGCASVNKVELIDFDLNVTDISGDLPAMPTANAITGDVYFVYFGGTLNNPVDCGLYYLRITMDNAKVYYSEWFDAEDIYSGSGYSDDHLIMYFSNTSDFGDILYSTGFTQKAWFKSEAMEPSFPVEEEGGKDGENRFIRTFARQTKKYLARTCTMPAYMVDVFNRIKLHDTVSITDLVGDTNYIFNLEVDHEWMGEDKYYAKIELTFDYDETVVVSGCGNNFI